jgi:REP element-mobilizing transposase RayT
MAQSLAKIYVHAIFSTKNRVPALTPKVRAELFPYFARVLTELKCPAVEIGGVADHMHVLCSLHKGMAAEDLMKEMKAPTSKWIKKFGGPLRQFSWQAGYGVFSVSPSNLSRVRKYIMIQEEHHRKEPFQVEFRRFLKRYQVEYDERYVWD